jgi:hypothetical protein
MFRGRTLMIATKHGKEAVLAPLFERSLGLRCMVPPDLDTDLLGTFTGEVERRGDPLSVAREKCLMAAAQVNADLILASEGSFGPHPSIPFVSAGDELLFLLDTTTKREFYSRELTTETNFHGEWVRDEDSLDQFLHKAGFPSHAVILRASETDTVHLRKGLAKKEDVLLHFNDLQSVHGKVWIETDMRAMHNPTRMRAIARAGEKLVEKLRSVCPACDAPGFAVTRPLPGLPCMGCGMPTRSTRALQRTCDVCMHSDEIAPSHGKAMEDPMYCDFCNP